ncbi:MAG TPA: FixH family protein, partial [Candidatus Methylomirabilis sp.]
SAAHLDIAHKEKELAMVEAEATYQQSVAARDERLFAKGAISQQEMENSRAMAAAARAKVQAARENIEHSRAMKTSALKKREAMAAMLAQSRAMLQTNEVVRDYVNIRAASGGYVVKRLVAPGVLVQPGMGILKITQIDKVRFQANVGEKDLPAIRVGSPVTVTLASAGSHSISARVTSVFPFVDQGARTAVVEAVVENRDHRFLPGQYVQMQFVTGDRPDALSVPAGAVVRLGGKATVWVVDGDRAEPREVTTGLENPDRAEIARGLVGNERVIVAGHDGLYAGARVRDVAAPAAPGQDGDRHKGMPGTKDHGESRPEAPRQPTQAGTGKPSGQGEAHGHGTGHGAGATVAQAPAAGAETGKLQVNLSTVPATPRVGDARLRIEVKDSAGAPVSGATVELSTGMPGMAGPKVAARAAKEPGLYEAAVNLGMVGVWTVEVTVTRPGGGATSAKFNLEVK